MKTGRLTLNRPKPAQPLLPTPQQPLKLQRLQRATALVGATPEKGLLKKAIEY